MAAWPLLTILPWARQSQRSHFADMVIRFLCLLQLLMLQLPADSERNGVWMPSTTSLAGHNPIVQVLYSFDIASPPLCSNARPNTSKGVSVKLALRRPACCPARPLRR